MQSDGWPPINCDRFEWENLATYKERSARIAQITTGFRMGRFSPEVADRMEEELIFLQEVGLFRPEQRLREAVGSQRPGRTCATEPA